MFCLEKPRVVFDELLPARPAFLHDPLRRAGCPLPRKIRLVRWRQLNQLHSMMYRQYGCFIDNLLDRQYLESQHVGAIILKVMGNSRTAQRAASAYSNSHLVESPQDNTNRKLAYDGPIIIVPCSTVRTSELPGFVWKSPTLDAIENELRSQWCGNDVTLYEEALILDHIEMYRKAIAAQKALIPHLVDFLSLDSALDRLNNCLTKLKVPKGTMQAIADKVSELDCLWTGSIPAEWLSTPPAPLPKPNKDCVIQEVSSGSSRWFRSAEADADCFVTIQTPPASHKQHAWALIPYDAGYAAQCPRTVTPSASQSHNQGASKLWGMRILKGMAAAGVGLAGLVAGRNDAAAAGYRSWLNKGRR